MSYSDLYPSSRLERDAWILEHRGARSKIDLDRPNAFFVEQEPTSGGNLASVATLLLAGSECRWRCAMCDLWQHTTAAPTPPGAIPRQIRFALTQLGPTEQVKLYNSGSFFDQRAVPQTDYQSIASLVSGHNRVIVESHPALIGDRVAEFRNLLSGDLEVAMGLETAHPQALEKLNKGITTEQFAEAADRLHSLSVDLRVFLLVHPPFIEVTDSIRWVERSIAFAFNCGATAVTLIPTRRGNGAMEELERYGDFTPPPLAALETCLEYGLRLHRGRVFVDMWKVESLARCTACRESRLERLCHANLHQEILPRLDCPSCGGAS